MSSIYYRTVWLSDIHLGSRDCHAPYLLDLLKQIECERIYLVGDIIDMLALKKRLYWPEEHYQVLRLLHDRANNGCKVVYIPGNHDAPVRDFVDGELLNVEIQRDYLHETVDGKRLIVLHGDIFDGAIRLHGLVRLIGEIGYDLIVRMNRHLHRLRARLGYDYWSLATYIKRHVKKARLAISIFENAAVAHARRMGADGIVCGHIHQPEIRRDGEILYCNDGDWVENCTALVETLSGELRLIHYSEQEQTLKTSRPLSEAA